MPVCDNEYFISGLIIYCSLFHTVFRNDNLEEFYMKVDLEKNYLHVQQLLVMRKKKNYILG